MEHLISELVRYFNIILIALYTYFAYRVLFIKDKNRQKRNYKYMSILMYFIHGFSYLVLYIKNVDIDYLILYTAQLLTFIFITVLYQKCYKNLSQLIFQNMKMLLCIGFIMLTRLSFDLAVKQYLFVFGTLLVCLIVPVMIKKFRSWGDMGILYLLIGLLLLLLVLIFGKEVYGAINWIVIGGFKFQPSEFVKLLFVFGTAALLKKNQDFKRVCLVTVLAAVHVIILVLERDLGGALLFFVTYIIILYCATRKPVYLFTGIIAGSIAAVAAYYIFSHVQVRVIAFLDPFAVIEKQGYQLAQSLFAIGTGSFFGMGLGNGMPESIPVVESDFIFSAIAEEMGGITAICIALICLSCFILFVNLSVKIKDSFYKLVALGFSTMYIFQVFLNIAGVIKMVPSTGITLPFVSSGGSSVISSILMFSMIQGIFVLGIDPKREEVTTVKQKEEQRNKFEQFNKSIVWITYVFSIFIFSAIGYFTYFQFTKAKSVINNTYNLRGDVLAKQVIRGKIYSSDGKILAQTISLEDGEEVRVYPFGNVFAHTVGRTDRGKTGIELSEYFSLLTSNMNGFDKISMQMKGEKVPGDNVVTTLNSVLQQAAYDALGNHKGAVVILEASTGKILAMVSKPDYNPNTVTEKWEELTEDVKGDSALLNRATQGLYPPGSTFKLLTLLEYIRESKDMSNDTKVSRLVNYEYNCTGSERNFGVTVHCAGDKSHGKQDLIASFANSCNSSFAHLGSTLNQNNFYQLCESFLFNKTLPTDIKTSVSSYSLTNTSDESEIPLTVIGLGKTLLTPLHNAMITAAVANGGILMKPYMISHVENIDGSIVKKYSPVSYGTLMSADEAAVLTEFMEYVVEEGTASKLSDLPILVAGKTGTAEYEIGKEPHAWFVGFAPANQPEIVISVVVESVGNGSSYAVPIAKKIIKAYLNIQ